MRAAQPTLWHELAAAHGAAARSCPSPGAHRYSSTGEKHAATSSANSSTDGAL
jgi:hypothetical protein